MKRFKTVERIDTSILYTLELASSISALLLTFGLIASMANVLTKGSVLSDNIAMQRLWAWTQCIAIEASVPGTIIRTFRYQFQREYVKCVLYGLLSLLLLFTAAIVSNIESVQQTLNVTLDKAYLHVFISIEVLIWVRSFVIVLLIVAHAMRHVQHEAEVPASSTAQPGTPTLTPEFVEAIRRALLQPVTIQEEQQALPAPQSEQLGQVEQQDASSYEQEASKFERAKQYLSEHPKATDRELASTFAISASTANKWKHRILEEVSTQNEAESRA